VDKELDPIDVHVGARIQLRRTVMGVTQEQLAEAIGVSFQQVQKYERGVNRLSASRMFDVCHALGVPVSFLFSDIPQELVTQRRVSIGLAPSAAPVPARDLMAKTESLELVRSYWQIPEEQRRNVRGLVEVMAKASRG
jgi:transcriptional regulator with XRE-family HTH domain